MKSILFLLQKQQKSTFSKDISLSSNSNFFFSNFSIFVFSPVEPLPLKQSGKHYVQKAENKLNSTKQKWSFLCFLHNCRSPSALLRVSPWISCDSKDSDFMSMMNRGEGMKNWVLCKHPGVTSIFTARVLGGKYEVLCDMVKKKKKKEINCNSPKKQDGEEIYFPLKEKQHLYLRTIDAEFIFLFRNVSKKYFCLPVW